MHAAIYRTFGAAADVLEIIDLPIPVPGPGEVRVRLSASGVNPSDVKSRAGKGRPLSQPWQIPGSDGAGFIDAIGDGVVTGRLGARVWTYNAAFHRANGTAAEFVVLPDTMAPALSAALTFERGACLGVPVMTAHRCVFAEGPVEGQTILVTGGAGVVGHYAIQLAKWGGASVIATVSSPEKAAHARTAGADHTVDYKTDDVVVAIKAITGGRGIDRIVDVDLEGNLPTSCKIIANGGTIVTYMSKPVPGQMYPFMALASLNVSIRHVLVSAMDAAAKGAAIDAIEAWTASGKAIFPIAARFPLADIAKAHEVVEDGRKIGHVILTLPE